jgi:hypothetical protein
VNDQETEKSALCSKVGTKRKKKINKNYYFTLTLPPNQTESMHQIFKFEKESTILSYKVFMLHV